MTKIIKLIRNIGIIIILLILLIRIGGLHFSPVTAYEKTERSLHYGPSDIIHIEDIDGDKLILGKYDKWISFMPVKKEFIFFWKAGGHSLGMEIDDREILNYWIGMTDDTYYCYGIINDQIVEEVEISLKDGRIFRGSDFYDDLFLIKWESENDYDGWRQINVKAYDANGKVIFEGEY